MHLNVFCVLHHPRDSDVCFETLGQKKSFLFCDFEMSSSTTTAPKRPPVGGPKANQVPDEILYDPVLNRRIAASLPDNYSFEIHKTIWRIRKVGAKRVALQFPDGLFIFAVPIVNLLKEFLLDEVEFVIMADVVYGACCVDDCKAKELGCDMIVHYGHSCLVPINTMAGGLVVLYVFVDIKFDILHLIQTVATNFRPEEHRLCIASTIQFVSSAHVAARELRDQHHFEVVVPQSRPLTPGEILGCTAPFLDEHHVNTLVFVADGRFHLEALMIANPGLAAYKYNPYSKELTREYYANEAMLSQRSAAVEKMVTVLRGDGACGAVGLILGTLGRQGNFTVLETLKALIGDVSPSTPVVTYLMSELNPVLLTELAGARKDGDGKSGKIAAWVQIGCPRLSIDWGDAFVDRPLLSPYELRTAVRNLQAEKRRKKEEEEEEEKNPEPNFTKDGRYHMDFYATKSLGAWTPSHRCHTECECAGGVVKA